MLAARIEGIGRCRLDFRTGELHVRPSGAAIPLPLAIPPPGLFPHHQSSARLIFGILADLISASIPKEFPS